MDGSTKKHTNKGRDYSGAKEIPTFFFNMEFQGHWEEK